MSNRSGMNAVSNANELNSITNLRQYILACPRNVVSNKSSSKVLKTVLQVLDELQTKLERDEKLRRKFAKAAAALTTIKRSSISDADSADIPSSSSVASPDVANTEAATVSSSICAMDEDWQDVHMTEQLSLHPVKIIFDKIQEQPVEKLPVSESSLGQRLASKSITLIAVQGTHIRKPVAGIAVALHATLVLLEFKCTGVWKEETSKGGGFAAPIRELPHTQFLPLNWDNQQGGDTVRLRYRKDGISGGNLHLKCTQFIDATDTRMIEVEFHPSGSRVECQNSVLFPMGEHFNLESLQVALAKSMDGSVPPALHYKSLASLLAQFVETFDVGAIPNSVERDEQSEIEALATDSMIQINTNDADDTIADAPVVLSMPNLIEKSRLVKDTQVERSRLAAFVNGPQINDMLKDILNPEPAQPARSDCDFSTDLHPSVGISIGGTNIDPLTGFAAPSRGGLNTGQTGNLMGPTHPMFMNPNHNNGDEVGNGGGLMLPTRGGGISMGGQGFGMVPRHDPLYPPGVIDPSDLHGGRGRGGGRGGRSGRGLNRDLRGPNPDHQRPPNNFSGGGMFL